MPYVAAVTDTWSRQSRVTVVNLRGIDDCWQVVSRFVGLFAMAGDHSSNAEAAMVKSIIDSVTGDDTMLVSVASDTENKAEKTYRLLAGEENRVGCVAHVLHLAVHDRY